MDLDVERLDIEVCTQVTQMCHMRTAANATIFRTMHDRTPYMPRQPNPEVQGRKAAGWHITGGTSLRVGSGLKLCNSLLPFHYHQACLSLITDLGFSAMQVFARMPKENHLKFGAFRVWADAAIAKSLPGPQYGSDSDDNDWGW